MPGVVLGIPGYALIKVVVTHLFKLFKIRYNKHVAAEGLYYEDVGWSKIGGIEHGKAVFIND